MAIKGLPTDVSMTDYQELCINNSGLVVSVMHSLSVFKTHPLYEDIYQEGMLGLYIACTRFDKSMGFELSSFAVPYIKGYILSFLGKAAGLKLPKGLRETFSLYKNIIKNTDLSDEEQATEIAYLLKSRGFTEVDIQNCWSTASLDEPVKTIQDDFVTFSLMDMLESNANELDNAIFRMDLDIVKDSIKKRFKKDKKCIIAIDILDGLEYGITQVEIAKKHNVTRQYISSVYKEVIKIAREVLLGYGYN